MLNSLRKEACMEFERCVLCGKDTPVDKGADLDSRLYYYEGCGQLCRDCYAALLQGETCRPSRKKGCKLSLKRVF